MSKSIRITLTPAEAAILVSIITGAIDDRDSGTEDDREEITNLASVEDKIRKARIAERDNS